jgi:hypothetical protein
MESVKLARFTPVPGSAASSFADSSAALSSLAAMFALTMRPKDSFKLKP